jgi:hypothetical protein
MHYIMQRRGYEGGLGGILEGTRMVGDHDHVVCAWRLFGLYRKPTLREDRLGARLRRSKVRAQLEAIIALCAGILGILTIFWHDWIEALTGWDPDQHNGTAEWVVVVGLLAVAVVMGLVARRHWRLLAEIPGQ